VDRLEGHWLKELAGVDARGAAGAEQGLQVGSTAAWLRNRLHLSDRAATSAVRRLDPTRLRRLLGHLLQIADPDSADGDRERRHARRGLWLAPTFEGMVAVDGLLEPEAGQSLLAAWSRWPAPPTPTMPAAVPNATLMPWASWPAAAWRVGGYPKWVGCGPS
jgi:Domain of unknown function (DUF222)